MASPVVLYIRDSMYDAAYFLLVPVLNHVAVINNIALMLVCLHDSKLGEAPQAIVTAKT